MQPHPGIGGFALPRLNPAGAPAAPLRGVFPSTGLPPAPPPLTAARNLIGSAACTPVSCSAAIRGKARQRARRWNLQRRLTHCLFVCTSSAALILSTMAGHTRLIFMPTLSNGPGTNSFCVCFYPCEGDDSHKLEYFTSKSG